MIEVEMTKDIRKYKTKLYMGLTSRQCLCAGLAAVVSVFTFFKLGSFENMTLETKLTICIVLCIPLMAVGWIEMYGMPFEKFVITIIKNGFINPKRRPYKIERVQIEEPKASHNEQLSKKELSQKKKEKKKKAKDLKKRRKNKNINPEYAGYR